MNSELSEIAITIDTREQNQRRIKAVEDWGIRHGAIVEHAKLDELDYHIEGDFNGKSVNIGIEAKGLFDFASSYKELKPRFSRAREIYDELALFIEVGNYTYTIENDSTAIIHNPAIRNGDADVLPLAVLEGLPDTLQRSGIHIRQLRSEAQFPDSMRNLLTYITNDHEIVGFEGIGNITAYKSRLLTLPNIGSKNVEKLILHYPNDFWLCSASEESLKVILGNKHGKAVYDAIHFHDLETDEWKRGMHKDGTLKDDPLYPEKEISQEEIDIKVESAIIEYLNGFPEGRNIEEICTHFNLPQGDFDRQTLHDYIKDLAVRGKITSEVTGLFKIPLSYEGDTDFLNSHKPEFIDVPKGYYACGDKIFPIEEPTISQLPGKDFSKSIVTNPPTLPVNPQENINVPPKTPSIPPADTSHKGKWVVPESHKMSLKHHLVEFFQEPHTLQEAVDAYGEKGLAGKGNWTGGRIFTLVVNSEKQGLLRTFPQKGQLMYVLAVQPDKDMDIGV